MKKSILVLLVFTISSFAVFGQTETELIQQMLNSPVKVWGWSSNGKTGISITYDPTNGEGRGDTVTKAYILNTVTDSVLWESLINTYDYTNESTWEINEKAYNSALTVLVNNFRQQCRHYAIVIQDTPLKKDPLAHNSGKQISFKVNAVYEDMEDPGKLKSYTVTAQTSDGKSKTIFNKKKIPVPAPYTTVSIYGICTSPDNERALVVILEESHWSIFYEFSGCILTKGYK